MVVSDIKSRFHPVMKFGLKWVHGSSTFEKKVASSVNEVKFGWLLMAQQSQWAMNRIGLAQVYYCTSCGAVVDWVFEDDILFICPKCSRVWHKAENFEDRLDEYRRAVDGESSISKKCRARQRDLVSVPEGCGVQEESLSRGSNGTSSEGKPPHGEGTD